MKITRATFKSFLKKNQDSLLVKSLSDFDGMVDCVMPTGNTGFRHETRQIDWADEHSFGIRPVWLVGQGRDHFTKYDKDGFEGIEVYNCCGNFVVAVSK